MENETLKELTLYGVMGVAMILSPLAVDSIKDTSRVINGVRCEQPYLSKREGIVLRLHEGLDVAGGRLCDTNRDGIVDEYRSELGCFKPLPVAFSRLKPTEAQVKLFAEATKNFYSTNGAKIK
jgi:hypothetical protein